ncbi:hypothetical protein [Amycolatopsis sp. CA-230715]|nr:hypothetical protein [Amycolatopsis sp. CA-230715]QWF81123.1 hypothetical protein HUW46_04549 [Amycolatopsis sp. CA-230715]
MKHICPTCNANTHIIKKKTDKDGNTVETEEVCPTCGGSGWVD